MRIISQMQKIRDTGEVRALLREWADDDKHPQGLRAHAAYVSTEPDENGAFLLTVHPDLLRELREYIEVAEL